MHPWSLGSHQLLPGRELSACGGGEQNFSGWSEGGFFQRAKTGNGSKNFQRSKRRAKHTIIYKRRILTPLGGQNFLEPKKRGQFFHTGQQEGQNFSPHVKGRGRKN